MSLVTEKYEIFGQETDHETGDPVVYVARETLINPAKLTVFKLMKRRNNWYNAGQFLSQGRFRTHDFAARSDRFRPLRLSDSRTDTELRRLAEICISE